MCINQILKLSMTLNSKKFHKMFRRCYNSADYLARDTEDEYIDYSLAADGITIIFCNKQYKKKIKVYLNFVTRPGADVAFLKKQVKRFESKIAAYFGPYYRIDDFVFCGMMLITDIDTGSRTYVPEYLKYLRRIGRVKGFSQIDDEQHECICLAGNSRAVKVLIYDIENSIMEYEQRSTGVKPANGALRIEIRLEKAKEIRRYCDIDAVPEQILELVKRKQDVFMDIFTQVLPFGDVYKKHKAEEIIREKISDRVSRRQMLRLLALIPEKKSLYLAQKEMNCRNFNEIMIKFAQINLSPVTLSKRQQVKYLRNLYEYL